MSDITATVDVTSNNVTVTAVGIQGASADVQNSKLEDLGNVDAQYLANGSVLVYKTNTSKWTSTRTLDLQIMEGGEF
jgi:hypothetical protein